MRLKHQADRLGLQCGSEVVPWGMKPKLNVSNFDRNDISADLVPEHPGDWIPFDSEMSPNPLPSGMKFNENDYGNFYLERYARRRNYHSKKPRQTAEQKKPKYDVDLSDDYVLETIEKAGESEHARGDRKNGGSTDSGADVELPCDRRQGGETRPLHNQHRKDSPLHNQHRKDSSTAGTDHEISQYKDSKAWDLLYDTVMVLKEGGNSALSTGNIPLAAQRYDKAIRYCSVAFLRFPEGHLSFLSSHQDVLLENGGHEVRWMPLLKALVTIRLNLSMTLLRLEAYFPTLACDHAGLALQELKPFVASKGSVLTGRKLTKSREGEPEETYIEAKELQAKAYFRLGNAQIVTGDYSGAVKSLDLSIKATKALKGSDAKPEAVVQRRLAEARKLNAKKRKRQREKFAFAFEHSAEVKNGEEEKYSDGE